jgi:hypothetical protein
MAAGGTAGNKNIMSSSDIKKPGNPVFYFYDNVSGIHPFIPSAE